MWVIMLGDVAGMGSDIFESYCGSMIASIAIAYTMRLGEPNDDFAPRTNSNWLNRIHHVGIIHR